MSVRVGSTFGNACVGVKICGHAITRMQSHAYLSRLEGLIDFVRLGELVFSVDWLVDFGDSAGEAS